MPNCAVIFFGHVVIQRNYEHMQNKRTNEILITYIVVNVPMLPI